MAYQMHSKEKRGDSRGGSKGPGGRGAGMGRRREKKEDVLGGRLRRKTCRFCEEKAVSLDYKDIKRLERLVSERGKILSRRVTGVCARHQRWVQEAVKKARFIALLPFLKK
ncbi:MAG: 30S ribosomal protein S18 [Candidatus Omnitrophota bacterium]